VSKQQSREEALVGWSEGTEYQTVFARNLGLKIDVQFTIFKSTRLESPSCEMPDRSMELRRNRFIPPRSK
jgi:hypothetical protein